jgi:hypothetical protein
MIHASNSLVRWREILERSAGTFQCRAELKSFLLLRVPVAVAKLRLQKAPGQNGH